jgi:hypothetical protein
MSVSLSSDGNVVAIGAYLNDGSIPGDSNAGHVRVYEWIGGAWSQKGADIDGEAADDESGWSVSLSSDGTIVAIGARLNDDGGTNSGHVRVYQYDVTKTTAVTDQTSSDFGPVGWRRLGADIDGELTGDSSGRSVSLSSDGSIVASGAYRNDGTGLSNSGHVRVYKYDEDKDAAVTDQTASDFGPIGWNRLGVDTDGEAANDLSGSSVSLNDNGRTVAIGARYNDGAGADAGHVRVYQSDNVGIQVGDWVYVNHEEAGNDGNVLSVYTYQVTAIVDADTLTLKWISATNSYVDDSPCDLCDGTGSSASCGGKAPHTFKRDLGSAYLMFVD